MPINEADSTAYFVVLSWCSGVPGFDCRLFISVFHDCITSCAFYNVPLFIAMNAIFDMVVCVIPTKRTRFQFSHHSAPPFCSNFEISAIIQPHFQAILLCLAHILHCNICYDMHIFGICSYDLLNQLFRV